MKETGIFKAKLEQLIQASSVINNSLSALQSLHFSEDLRASAGFRLTAIVKQIDEKMKVFNESRIKLCEKYAKKNKKGEFDLDEQGNFQFSDENKPQFQSEYEELVSQDVELIGSKLKRFDVADVKISAYKLSLLTFLFED